MTKQEIQKEGFMVRPVGDTPQAQGPVTPSQTPKKLPAALGSLQKLRDVVDEFVHHKGKDLLGAGKSPTITNQAPGDASKKVSDAVKRSI
jgi:hypothetical protein